MKFWIRILLILTAVTFLHADVVKKTYIFDYFKITEKDSYQIIHLMDVKQCGPIGEPLLPYHHVALQLPPGHVAKTVSVQLDDWIFISGYFNLFPKQSVRPMSEPSVPTFRKNMALYKMDADYPASHLGPATTQFLDGMPILITTFTPVRYNPLKGEVRLAKKVTVLVETELDQKALKSFESYAAGKTSKRVNKFAQNCSGINQNPVFTTDAYSRNILIITPASFVEGFSQLEFLYHQKGGIPQFLTTEEITAQYSGQDLQEKIRNAIIDRVQAGNLGHVILGGDVEHIPYRGLWGRVQSGPDLYQTNNIPSDLYYSALDGTWDANENGIWGEIGEEDLLPEVSVGRLPFSTMEELGNISHKICSYQTAPVTGELQRPILAAEKFWDNPLTWGAGYLDLIIGTHDDNGYTTTGIPPDHDIIKLYDRDETWGSNELIALINEGTSFIHHSGHSNSSYNMRMTSMRIINDNFSMVDGITHNFPLAYSGGCSSGAFDYDDCIGELMLTLERFLVAYVGNSRLGWDNEGFTEGPSSHLHREFVDALYGEGMETLGNAQLDSKLDSAPWVNAPGEWEEGAHRWVHFACNVLGDPTLSVWTEEPTTISLSGSAYQADGGQPRLTVNLTSENNDIAGYRCVLMTADVPIAFGMTDNTGLVEFMLEPGIAEAGGLSLYVSGKNYPPVFFEVQIFDDSVIPSEGIATFPNFPNPFNGETRILYALAESGHVNLAVYDMRGRLVTTLVDSERSSGMQSAVWNGVDQNGDIAPSGLYFYQIESGKHVESGKIILTR